MTGGPGTNGENQSPFVFCGGKAAHNKMGAGSPQRRENLVNAGNL